MHKNTLVSSRPLPALDVQFLELILLILKVLEEIEDVLGIDFNLGNK